MSGAIVIFMLFLVTLGTAWFLYSEWGKARKEADVNAEALDTACKDVLKLETERDQLTTVLADARKRWGYWEAEAKMWRRVQGRLIINSPVGYR